MTSRDEIFARLDGAKRIWAVAAVHGDAAKLRALHARLLPKLMTGDRLIYLGDFLGIGPEIIGTVDELLAARAEAMCVPGMEPWDIAYLRGDQEEMWDKLLQIQFASNPMETLDWMYERGVMPTVEAYGGNPEMGRRCARDGAVALTQWTTALRETMRGYPGHDALFGELKRAGLAADVGAMFVNAGIDRNESFDEQRDAYWWGGASFASKDEPFDQYRMIVRGYDPDHGGKAIGQHTATIDGGCGWNGTLNAACMDQGGEFIEWIEV